MANIGPGGLLLLLIISLLLFGPKKLPELGRSVGQTFRQFKIGTQEMLNENNSDEQSKK